MDYKIKFTKTCNVAIDFGRKGSMKITKDETFDANTIERRRWAEQWIDCEVAEFIKINDKEAKAVEAVKEVQKEIIEEAPQIIEEVEIKEVVKKRGRPSKKGK